jgi:hypothetical protein
MENGKFFLFHRGKALLLSPKSKGLKKDPALTTFAQTLQINPNLKSDSGAATFSFNVFDYSNHPKTRPFWHKTV